MIFQVPSVVEDIISREKGGVSLHRIRLTRLEWRRASIVDSGKA